MNCKQGDLAIVVRSSSGNEGKIVRCVEFLGPMRFVNQNFVEFTADAWRVDPPQHLWDGRIGDRCCDNQLRPILDAPGMDETLTWVGVPHLLDQIQ